MSTDTIDRCENVADDLLDIIRPYYKSLRKSGEKPDFRKCLKSSEVEDILGGVHEIVVKLRTTEQS